MRTRRDQTDVPNTCQYIDEVIDTLKTYVDNEEDLTEALKYCEVIRHHNSTLREFGNELYYQKEDLEEEIEDLENKIENLKEDIESFKEENDRLEDKFDEALDEIYELKSEIEDLKLSKYEN
jgi:predicted nuclease with TOPRIM domain